MKGVILTLDFHCAKCGKKLGTYKGESLTFVADVPFIKSLKTICEPSCDIPEHTKKEVE